jgi:peptide/nickel transport system permease protein
MLRRSANPHAEPASGRDGKRIGIRLRRFFLNSLLRIAAVLLVASTAMILVRYGPGFATDDRDLDPTASAETRTTLHNRNLAQGALLQYARNLVVGAFHGDFGQSRALDVPVRDLIAERGPVTLRILVVGTALAWLVGLSWAVALALVRAPFLAGASAFANACLLCLPTAAVAALLLNADWPAETVLAVALLPKIFQVCQGLLAQSVATGDVIAARARGIGSARILGCYILPRIAGPLLAWLAATAGLAVGAIVPIEVICDVPGLGQLAWKAALARDLPVLVVLTLLVALIIQLSNSASTLLAGALPRTAGEQQA